MDSQKNTNVPSSTNVALVPSPATAIPPVHNPANEPESSLAAQRVAADMELVVGGETEAINIDSVWLVTFVLASTTRLATYQHAIAALPGIDATRIGKLRDYTLALAYWQGRTQSSAVHTPELAAMVARAVEIRDRTLGDLKSLANHGLIAASQLEKFVGSPAHRKLGLDLVSMAGLVHTEWPRIGGKTLITLEAMDEAATLGERILQAAGERDAATTVEASQAQKQRDKAYTLVVRTYAQARRAITFLRFDEGDAEVILPSLYAGRGGRKRGDEATASPTDRDATPAAPSVIGANDAPSASGDVVYSAMIGAAPLKA